MLAPVLMVLATAAAQPAAGRLTLQEAIAEAEAHSPSIEAASADIETARARTVQARSSGLPSASLSGTVGVGRLNPGGFFGLQAANVTPRAAQATIEQPLFTGGRVSAAVEGARSGERQADAERERVRADLAAQVAAAFGSVLLAQEQRRLYQSLVVSTAELARQAHERFRVGDAPITDVSQANARLAEACAQVAAASGAILGARAHLAHLIGHEPGVLALLPSPAEVPPDLQSAILGAEEASPAIKQAKAALDAAAAAERGARAERLPTIGAFAEASTIRDQFFPGYRADSATVGLRANWQFFDIGRVRGKIAETKSAVRSARARLAEAREAMEDAVTGAYAEVEAGVLVAQAASEQRSASETAARNVREEVKIGEKPQIDLLNAEREATAASVAALKAWVEEVTATYRLNALLGRH